MPFTMHRYPDGLTGLAAFCDTCGEQITEHGYVVWDPENVNDWLVVHQRRCDPGVRGASGRDRYSHSMPLDTEIVYLANSAGADLDKAREDLDVFAM